MIELMKEDNKCYHVSFRFMGNKHTAWSLFRKERCVAIMLIDEKDNEIKMCDADEDLLDAMHNAFDLEREAYYSGRAEVWDRRRGES